MTAHLHIVARNDHPRPSGARLVTLRLVAGTAFDAAAARPSAAQTTEEFFRELFAGDMSVHQKLSQMPDPWAQK